jgi:beta-N-acetylhexosaminidase
MLCVGFDGLVVSIQLRELIARGVRSVILFSRNFESRQQLTALCSEIKSLSNEPILVCVDHEGGRVQRFHDGFTRIPSMREIGSAGDEAAAYTLGSAMARELRAAHIDLNLAPVLDVDSNPNNPVIGERSLGADPALVAQLGCALIRGMQHAPEGMSIAACAKHFPGHGDTSIDSHLDLPILDHDLERIQQIELPPFIAAIKSGVASIMASHVLFRAIDPDFPASMSTKIINGLLRTQLGYQGVVISDDLEMNAIVNHFGIDNAVIRGAAAGVDLLCICHDSQRQHAAIDALMQAVSSRQVPMSALRNSAMRLNQLSAKYVRRLT